MASPQPQGPQTTDTADFQDCQEPPKKYCCNKLTKKQLLVVLLVLFLLGVGLAILVTYFVAKSIVNGATVEPTRIQMNVDHAAHRRLTSSAEVIRLGLEAAVTNGAFLGGAICQAKMNVYATIADTEVLVVQMTIPETAVEAQVEGAAVTICDIDRTEDDGNCILADLTNADLDKLHDLVEHVKAVPSLVMRMEAPDGVQLKSMGIKLPFSFDFDRTFTAAGMDGALQKAQIATFTMDRSVPDQVRFQASASVHNPSIFGFNLLPTKMDMYLPRDIATPTCPQLLAIGTGRTEMATPLPSKSSATMTILGEMQVNDIDPTCLETFLQNYLTGQPNILQSKIPTGATTSAYLNHLLDGTVLLATLLPLQTPLVVAMDMADMNMSEAQNHSVRLAAQSTVTTQELLGDVQLQVDMLDMDARMETPDGIVLGTLTVSSDDIVMVRNTNPVQANLDTVLHLVKDGIPMKNWMKLFLEQETIGSRVVGTASVSAQLPGFQGPVILHQIPINNLVQLPGMNKGKTFRVNVDAFDIPTDTQDGLAVTMTGSFDNPSPAQLDVGTLAGTMYYQGERIGTMQVPNFTIQRGRNVFSGTGVVQHYDRELTFLKLQAFFNAYMNGQSAETRIESQVDGASWLNALMGETEMVARIDGMPQGKQVLQGMAFVETTDLNVKMTREESRFTGRIQATMKMPFAFPVRILSYAGQVQLSSPTGALDNIGTLTMQPEQCLGHCMVDSPVELQLNATLNVSNAAQFESFVQMSVSGQYQAQKLHATIMDITGAMTCIISTKLDYQNRPMQVVAPVDTRSFTQGKLSMPTFDGLGPIKIKDMDLRPGKSATLLPIVSRCSMHNPTSFVNMHISDVPLGIYLDGKLTARVHNNGKDVVLGKDADTALTMLGEVDTLMPGFDKDAADTLFANYIGNITSHVVIKAFPDPTYLVQNGMSHIELTSQIPPLRCRGSHNKCDLVTGTDFKSFRVLDPIELIKRIYHKATGSKKYNGQVSLLKDATIVMNVHNAFAHVSMVSHEYDVKINYDKTYFGYMDSSKRTVIEPLATEGIEFVVQDVDTNSFERQMKMNCDLLLDQLYVDAGDGTRMKAYVGKYYLDVAYAQQHVKISCKLRNGLIKPLCKMFLENTHLMQLLERFGGCKKMSQRSIEILEDHRRLAAQLEVA